MLAYALTAAAAVALAVACYGVRPGDVAVPIWYQGDSFFTLAMMKGLIAHGGFLENPDLGAPEGQTFHDFPYVYGLHMALLRGAAVAVSEPGTLVNGFWLLGFGAISAAALFALRQLRAPWPEAIVASWLYAFLPYHLLRGEMHLFLSAYYLVPLAALLAIRLHHDAERIAAGGGFWPRASRREWVFAVLVALALGSVGFYYAFFGGFLFVAAGALGALRARRAAPLAAAFALTALTLASTFCNVIPNFRFWAEHGRNAKALQRPLGHAEVFGLKISQLLLPVRGHRIPAFEEVQRRYASAMPLVNENEAAALGTVAAAGWLLLIGRSLTGPARGAARSLLDSLAPLNLAITLLGTLGGFGSLVALLVLPEIRAYNRVSIFLAFFALAALVLAVQPLRRRLVGSAGGRLLGATGLAAVLAFGLFDVIAPGNLPDRDAVGRVFHDDRAFVAAIEPTFPPDTSVFQLPDVPYPEAVPAFEMAPYDSLRPYLHARTLRFSHGAMKGRPAADRHAQLAALPPAELPAALHAAGYGALLVDRFGYADRASALEAMLTKELGAPRASAGGRWLLFSLAIE